eukprot:c9662_g1_i1.p1 GENE.c9662_g1_i1~~c9662_g1_i1.p1  ORF type:complete len:265 (+),score=26.68 c9662_g1_i1:30-797(+)
MSMSAQACLGYLHLKGVDGNAQRDLREWSCSLCLLRAGKIIHFDIDPATPPKGKIPLTQAAAETSKGAVPGSLYAASECFKIVTPARVFHIFAETYENRNKWVSLLTDHIQKLNSGAISKATTSSLKLKDQIATADRVEFLTKSGGIRNLSWKKRLFVLNGEFLVYYELPQGLRARGNYSCQSCKDYSSADLPSYIDSCAVLQVESDCGTLLLGAQNEADKQRWRMALTMHSDSIDEPVASLPMTEPVGAGEGFT